MLWTSDTHWGHANIVGYCNRPFSSTEEMNLEMVRRWNEVVTPQDTVYFLGDFAMGPRANASKFRSQLNGRIVLIQGNHDRSKTAMLEAGFDEVYNELTIQLDGVEIYMRHKPDYNFVGGPDKIHLCGHVHGEWRTKGHIFNVGVDVNNFYPVTLRGIQFRMSQDRVLRKYSSVFKKLAEID